MSEPVQPDIARQTNESRCPVCHAMHPQHHAGCPALSYSRTEHPQAPAPNEREKFEDAAHKNEADNVLFKGGQFGVSWIYDDRTTQSRWEGWQACAASSTRATPEPVWCGCGDGIMPNTGAKCGVCASLDLADLETDAKRWRQIRGMFASNALGKELYRILGDVRATRREVDAAVDAAIEAGRADKQG